MFSCFSRLRKRLCDISSLDVQTAPPIILKADKPHHPSFRFCIFSPLRKRFLIVEVINMDNEIALRQVEGIIKYQFNDHRIFTCSLWELRTTVFEPLPDTPRLDFFIRMGQLVLDAVGWELFWTKKLLTGGWQERMLSQNSLAHYVLLRGAWDEDVNLEKVAKGSGLLPYLNSRDGLIGPRLQAIIGAVLVDAEGRLTQVKNVLRVLRIIDEEGLCSIAG